MGAWTGRPGGKALLARVQILQSGGFVPPAKVSKAYGTIGALEARI